jgi:hypothetical protein
MGGRRELIEITEPKDTKLRVVESDSSKLPPGVIMRLEGVFGETEKETANGRAYSNALWRRTFSSDDFRSRLESRSLLGEADHPEGLETSITRVSHAISDEYLDEDNNEVRGAIDVLDTPSGRIVKTLADYGWIPGISSRGAGDVVQREGRTEIDPDTYEYIVHDIVIDPACEKARLSKVDESKNAGVPLKEALSRLAKEDKGLYAKGDYGYFKELFEKRFGIDIDGLEGGEKSKSDLEKENASLRRRVRELAEAVTESRPRAGSAAPSLREAYLEKRRRLERLEDAYEAAVGRLDDMKQSLDTIERRAVVRVEAVSKGLASSKRRELRIRREKAALEEKVGELEREVRAAKKIAELAERRIPTRAPKDDAGRDGKRRKGEKGTKTEKRRVSRRPAKAKKRRAFRSPRNARRRDDGGISARIEVDESTKDRDSRRSADDRRLAEIEERTARSVNGARS